MNLIWQKNGISLNNNTLVFDVGFPSITSTSETVTLSSSAMTDGTFASLQNVKLYLQGDPDQINTLLNIWPNYGSGSSPARPDLNGGIEISFDRGSTFQRLGSLPGGPNLGFPDDPSTWITLPGSCIVPGATSGVLGSTDLATLSIRYVIPPLADQFQVFNVRLEGSFDVV